MGDLNLDASRNDWDAGEGYGEPVGSAPRYLDTSACRILERDGAVVFGIEHAISISAEYRPLASASPRGAWRLEAATRMGNGIEPGETLVVSEDPRSNGWLAVAPFKRGHKRARTLPEAPDTLFEGQVLSNAAEGRWGGVDFWTTSPDRLIASPTTGPQVKELLHPIPRSLHTTSCPHWVFGVCDDATRLRAKLMGSADSAALLSPDRTSVSSVWGRDGIRAKREIHPQTMAEGPDLLSLAIGQALAGPSASDPPPSATNGWVNVPVMELARRIFDDHLCNRSRQLATQV